MEREMERSVRPEEMEKPLVPKKSRFREICHLLGRNRLAFFGLIIFFLFGFVVLLGTHLTHLLSGPVIHHTPLNLLSSPIL